MIVTVANMKGGVGKTTTAIHLARYFRDFGRTLLIDSDTVENEGNARGYFAAGPGAPFDLCGKDEAVKVARDSQPEHTVIDTVQGEKDLKSLLLGCDLLVIPAVPGSQDTRGLVSTLRKVNEIGVGKYRVLMVKVPPATEPDGATLRRILEQNEIPTLAAEVPRLKVFERAAAAGITVDQVKHRDASRAWDAYKAAGKEIANG